MVFGGCRWSWRTEGCRSRDLVMGGMPGAARLQPCGPLQGDGQQPL